MNKFLDFVILACASVFLVVTYAVLIVAVFSPAIALLAVTAAAIKYVFG